MEHLKVNMLILEIYMVMSYVILKWKYADLWSLMWLGGPTGIKPLTRKRHPTGGTSKWLPPLLA
jgi:hypothetical protein